MVYFWCDEGKSWQDFLVLVSPASYMDKSDKYTPFLLRADLVMNMRPEVEFTVRFLVSHSGMLSI
jgi:hypothetical protein